MDSMEHIGAKNPRNPRTLYRNKDKPMTYNDNVAYAEKSNPLQAGKGISVEAILVWTYRHQRAHAVSEHGVSLERAEAAIDAGGAPHLAMSGNAAAACPLKPEPK